MNNQELFDTVKNHLLTQRKKSTAQPHGFGLSSYRGINGLKCAIGCLIPDEKYLPDFESFSVAQPKVYRAAGLSPNQVQLARRLQVIHDVTPVKDWEKLLKIAAHDFGLKE